MAEQRLDLHNAACDEVVANAGLCAATDLRTGRVCVRPVRHHGSCDFVSKDTSRAVAAETGLVIIPRQDLVTALDDPARLAVTRHLEALRQPPDQVLDRLTLTAAELLEAPVALLTLVRPDEQFFVSSFGLPEDLGSARRTPVEYSICQYAVTSGAPFIVKDTSREPRLAGNRAVSELGVAAYAGIPVVTSSRFVVGALCVVDLVCRDWRDDQLNFLDTLANLCSAELDRDTATLDAAGDPSETTGRSLVC